MSDNVNPSNPLEMNFDNVDTSLPMFKSGIVAEFKIVHATAMPNEARTLKLELESLEPLPAHIEGETLPPGSKLFANVNTHPTGKNTAQSMLRGPNSMGAFGKCVGRGTTLSMLQQNVEQLQGRIIKLRTTIRPGGEGKDGVYRGPRSEVAEWCIHKDFTSTPQVA